ncbi:AAA domain-containing protein, putative AbiEii toxin, Type IV TA system [Prevotellaceae bacterium HUN156]|nr:AAA domain-containing protein, putative AbiEii toxin, Type IV TA system [Prevotellaceae bacterium HUN156]
MFVNRAPFKNDLEIVFHDGVNVLCGINGRGKTTILSYIVDAIYEMARLNYPGSFEGKETKYYRVSSGLHLMDSSKPGIVYIRFILEGRAIDYIDVRGKLTEEDYNRLVKYDRKIDFNKIRNGLENSNTVKLFSCDNTNQGIKNAFLKNVLTYFPSYRYELPGFLNTPYKNEVEFNNTIRFTGELPNPIEVLTGLEDFSSWILDVVLDWEVNKETQKVQQQEGVVEVDLTPERMLWNNLSNMMKSILISKNYSGTVRFGIGRRNRSGDRISVIHDINRYNRELICPNLSFLSSGETALMCLFGEVIRQADKLHNNVSLDHIEGIVLIDEIEKHLHIRLQKETLPNLLKLFPNVQFIVSSHSPFLNMGLGDVCPDKTHIIDLDNDGIMTTPIYNDVYQETYELFLNEKNRFATEYEKVSDKLKQMTRPVVITEGKTDIKHILKAMQELGIEQQFDVLPEADQPDGESTLLNIVKNQCKIPQPRKIIAVFDRDTNTTKDITDPYKDYGNNVYALRIRCPQSRVDDGRTAISIEYLYSDDEIHAVLPNDCQLFFGNEFSDDSTRRHITNPDLRLNTKDGLGKDKIVENNGGQAVYDKDFNNHLAKKEDFAEAIINNQIAISQQSWENFRPTIDLINQIIEL